MHGALGQSSVMAIPNHFTCTLGQAAELNKAIQPISDISNFIDQQADDRPHAPAVVFPVPGENDEAWDLDVFSFRDIQRGSSSQQLDYLSESSRETVAVLCQSTPSLLFTWLGLMRRGRSVLLLAAQCQPSAIAHLLKTCDVEVLIYDEVYEQQATETQSQRQPERLHIRVLNLDVSAMVKDVNDTQTRRQSPKPEIAYLHHTSGTSTGLPKPIPQNYRAALGVLPQTLDAFDEAVFTTTPLYHGGVADSLRAWTSNAMICLFPGKSVPITAKNIVLCLEAVKNAKRDPLPQIRCFSSVPYVLQMMASDGEGLQHLQRMRLVGVGGAALPSEVGDDLVHKDVNLISRFGSAECGFLMSSDRECEIDKEWQYLRNSAEPGYLNFEPQGDGTYELVIENKWPHRAKMNREDGSFATADLFVPHPTTPSAWKYHSRADSQLTLITGKKFDPAPFESSIATSPLLDDVLIFGNGQPYPGALLFRSEKAQAMSDEDLIAALAASIEKLNADSQDHARLARNMLVPVEHGENRLEKSSKGTILRGKAEEIYADQIEQAYSGLSSDVSPNVANEDLFPLLRDHIVWIVGRGQELHADTDLFSFGVDSVASIQIRHILQMLLLAESSALPLSVVEDCGTVERLVDFITKKRHGTELEREDELELMRKLVNQYSDFSRIEAPPALNGHVGSSATRPDGEVILLTGATGALGAHLLDLYRSHPSVSRIHILIRGADDHSAHERVNKALTSRSLPGLDSSKPPNSPTITIHRTQLSAPTLGLDPSTYTTLQNEVTQITHAAWSVDFRMRLRSFVKDHIAGLRHLLDFALAGSQHPKLAFISTLASISAAQPAEGGALFETPSHNPNEASPLGYSRSKWVAEAVLSQASKVHPAARDRLSIFRVGQLSGDTQHGVWNASEAWPMMLASAKATSALPDLGKGEKLNWLGVDLAACGIVEATSNSRLGDDKADATGAQVYHVLNDAATPATWDDLVRWMRRLEPDTQILHPKEWLGRMEQLQSERSDHPALKLLGLWKAVYGGDGNDGIDEDAKEEAGSSTAEVRFDTARARSVAPSLRDVRAVDEEYFGKLWGWIKENV